MQTAKDEPYHVSIEIVNRHCQVTKTLKESGVNQFNIIDLRSAKSNTTRHLVKIPSQQVDRIPQRVKISQNNGKIETSVWIDSSGCDVCTTILSNSSFLISGRTVEDGALLYSFIAPSFEAFQTIISELEGKGFTPKILEVGKFQRQRAILTEKQERVLWFALKMGFFEYPKKIHTEELSRRLKISPSTLSETLRRGIRRLLEDHFET
ncbi:MAG: helix-turn-helix domain-containing protein [Candidatus Bathyarchaeota archaeon]|nr:MAG: helix-turn-helix domain-containing protein [Candidatus Bathyarchaeota archaeon]